MAIEQYSEPEFEIDPGEIVVGPARADRRTKELVKRLCPGDIAVIDHADIDRVAAENLIRAAPSAVINASTSFTGRYPHVGPLLIAEAGIPLIDDVGPEIIDLVDEGEELRLVGNDLWRGEEFLVGGRRQEADDLARRVVRARADMGAELEAFAVNTLEWIRREARLTFEPLVLPPLRADFRGRHALVVVRGHDYRSDLKALRAYIREFQPVLVAVDGGADALMEVGLRPDIIIGDFDSVSEEALACGADLVHHVHPDGRAPGREDLLRWGVSYVEFVAEGTSEDVAMLLSAEAGAELIVAVGTHASMVEFLDKGRAGMASTFLTRLRLGPLLVDAKGVNRLYETRLRRRDLAVLIGAAFLAMLVVTIVSEPLHVFLSGLWVVIRDGWLRIADTVAG
ncbi:MAG TPA: putative cytokinetic ring protein SteA [Acidimicrobiia bacterium]|nr:putative cytokinetic ring protein SteA [Acidimicrobiia bacterium]